MSFRWGRGFFLRSWSQTAYVLKTYSLQSYKKWLKGTKTSLSALAYMTYRPHRPRYPIGDPTGSRYIHCQFLCHCSYNLCLLPQQKLNDCQMRNGITIGVSKRLLCQGKRFQRQEVTSRPPKAMLRGGKDCWLEYLGLTWQAIITFAPPAEKSQSGVRSSSWKGAGMPPVERTLFNSFMHLHIILN